MLKSTPHDKAVDWWSLGVVLFKLLTGKRPYKGKVDVMCEQISEKLDFGKAKISEELVNLILGLLKEQHVDRLGSSDADSILKHRFFEGMNQEQFL